MLLPNTLVLLSFLIPALASPHPTSILSPQATATPAALDLRHHDTRQFSDDVEVRRSWLSDQADGIRGKYASQLSERDSQLHQRSLQRRASLSISKRATANITLADIGIDASYSASVSIGNPAQQFLVILDTGSSDLWVTGSSCQSASCLSTTPFYSNSSSSFRTNGEPFSITYGSGTATGTVGTDTVSLGGFTVNDQGMAVVNATSANLITAPNSGLMGLAFKALSQTAATPFWQTLAASGNWDQQVMGFYLRRFRGTKGVSNVEAQGGTFFMGGLDNTKYTGDINYIEIPSSNLDFWRITAQAMTVNGQSVSINAPQAAIDTGTTLIGVPSSVAASIYAQIPGASAMSSSSGYAGYWQYPCSTNVNVTLQFGGLSYAVSNQDFNLGSFNQGDTSMCTGAFFEMNLNSRSPIQWIVGASFMKNVYTSFRYNPPAVGFAALASGVNGGSSISSGNGNNATSGTNTASNDAARRPGGMTWLGKAGLVGIMLTLGAAALGL